MQIDTQQGSATSPRPDSAHGVIIAHLNNHVGAWGRGFVLAVNELSPIPRKAYKEMAQRHSKNIPLGETQMLEVEPNLWVANMVAQNGINKDDGDGCLVDYKALNKCLETVFERAVLLGCNVHIPSGMGSGLAGGSESMIHDIIKTCATRAEIDLLERRVNFVPRITLWEFDDTTANSYVGKPTASKQAMVDSVFGTSDTDDTADEVLDDILNDL